jgi:predicted small integral membrane protein
MNAMSLDTPAKVPAKHGFLPITTNLFDRIFIAVVLFVAIHLFWMRFVEQSLSLYFATAISVVVGAIVIKRG